MTPRPDEGKDRVDESVSRILDRAELEDAPADLRRNVLRAIASRPDPASAPGLPGWVETLRAGLTGRWPALVAPFAAGLAVGVVAFAILQGGWRGAGADAEVDGVMAPATGEPAAARAKVDDQSFELGRANVRFEVFRSGDRGAVSVTADAAKEPVVVTVQPAQGSARVERVLAIPSAAGSVEYGPGWVRIWLSGRDRAEVGLAMSPGAGDAPAEIVVTSRGQSVQGSLHTGGVPPAPAKRAGS